LLIALSHMTARSLSPSIRRLIVCVSLTLAASALLAAPPPEPRIIEVTARRFAFEPSEIEVAVGEPVRLMVRSADGVHGLEIKKLKVRKEIPRGEVVTINFTAKEAGRFPIMCSEYCGDDHDNMRGMLVVVAPGEVAAPGDEGAK
jgi:cytochrome c oxidase subunit 2